MTKSPKLYFLDAGLAAWLSGWRSVEEARLGPMGGFLFETEVLSEILRAFHHRAREVEVRFWRTRDGQEVDFLVEADGRVFPVEVKMGSPDASALARLEAISSPNWQPGQVVSLAAEDAPVSLTPEWRLCAPHGLDLGLA